MDNIHCWFILVAILFFLQQFSFARRTNVKHVITMKSMHSVKDTMDLVERDIKEQGGTVFCRIDQKKAAEQAGLVNQLNDTELIIFGNPKVGTQLMVANGMVSIELPLRIACWQRYGNVYLSATNPRALEAPYNLRSKREVLKRMSDSIIQMMKRVIA